MINAISSFLTNIYNLVSSGVYAQNFELGRFCTVESSQVRRATSHLPFVNVFSIPRNPAGFAYDSISVIYSTDILYCHTNSQTQMHASVYRRLYTYLHTHSNAVTYAFWQWGVLIYDLKFCLAMIFSNFVIMIKFIIALEHS